MKGHVFTIQEKTVTNSQNLPGTLQLISLLFGKFHETQRTWGRFCLNPQKRIVTQMGEVKKTLTRFGEDGGNHSQIYIAVMWVKGEIQ